MTLVDRFAPTPDFAERHEIEIPASPDVVWAAWQGMALAEPPRPVRWLFAARGLIARLRHGHTHRDLPDVFIPLAEDRPREIVEGVVGRWWAMGAHKNRADIDGPDAFQAFAEPGYGKGVIAIRFVEAAPGRTRVTSETQVICTDAAARRAMARYWPLIRPFSGLIRILLLRALAKRSTR